jgi:glycosyltransferase involved in cell wall biosynthesis
MKVLFISFTSLLQKMYQKRACEISKYCDDINILTPKYWKEIWKNKKVLLEGRLIPEKHLTGKIFFTGNLHFACFINKFVDLLKHFRPDVIDMENEPFNLGSLQLILYKKIFSPKSIVVLHASQNIFKKYPFPFNIIEKYVLREADMIFARTAMAMDILIQKGRKDNVYVIPHGVDVGHFKKIQISKEREQYLLNDSIVLGYIGALTRQKGLDLLLNAVAISNKKIKVLIVGDGPEKENLKELADSLNIKDKIIFTGACAHENIVGYLNAMDIFVLPSITVEGLKEKFGRVLLEAMACEVPVIGSSSGEIPNVIKDNGFVFTEGKVDDLKNKMELLIDNENLRIDMGRQGRYYVVDNFSWKVLAEKTVAAYRTLLSA